MCEFDITISVPLRSSPYIGSSSEYNLWQAFASECMAYMRYSYYADEARDSGYECIASAFEKAARNEKEHAYIWFKELNQIGSLIENLGMTAINENYEWSKAYPQMARDAYNEGFDRLGKLFDSIGKVEHRHEREIREIIDSIETDSCYSQDKVVIWECRSCGHIIISKAAPDKCPICSHDQGHFQLLTKRPE